MHDYDKLLRAALMTAHRYARGGYADRGFVEGEATYDPMGNVIVGGGSEDTSSPLYKAIEAASIGLGKAGAAVGEPLRRGAENYLGNVGQAFHESGEYAKQGLENTVSDKGPLYNTSGPLQYALGSMGQAFSPLTGAAMSAGQAATQLTGNPDIGSRVELVGGLVDPSHAGALKTAARAAHEVAPAIVPIAAAKKLTTDVALPQTNEFALAVKNTPGARIEDDRLILSLTRNQRPEQAGSESVRGGVFYLPEGSPNQKYYTGSGFNSGYGGSEPIKGETALSNPLLVKGATGGKAPEAAYIQLKGKDAFKEMQDDVYRSLGAPYLEKDIRKELVKEFLDKHAPDVSPMSDYIFDKSSKGNQLRYALQEAAVAQAARDAGHDAVVGYSMSRKTKEPFISEVFDVRENKYPSKSGEHSVWPKFEATEPQMGVGNIGWDQNRINKEINYSHYDDGRSKAMVAFVNPNDFLAATTPSAKAAKDIAKEAGALDLKKLSNESQSPFLKVENGKITNHEGRHRMAAMAAAGYDRVPVILDYGKGSNLSPSNLLSFKGQHPKRPSIEIQNAVPLNKQYADQISKIMQEKETHFKRGGTIPFGPEAAQRAVQIAKQQAGRR